MQITPFRDRERGPDSLFIQDEMVTVGSISNEPEMFESIERFQSCCCSMFIEDVITIT